MSLHIDRSMLACCLRSSAFLLALSALGFFGALSGRATAFDDPPITEQDKRKQEEGRKKLAELRARRNSTDQSDSQTPKNAAGGPKEERPPGKWSFVPDPATTTFELPRGKRVEIVGPNTTGFPLIIFSGHGSPFAGVGKPNNFRGSMDFYNLATGRKVGSLKGRLEVIEPFALSDDGTLFAGYSMRDRSIVLYDVELARPVHLFATDRRPNALFFAGPKRLVSVSSVGNAAIFVWDLELEKQLAYLEVDRFQSCAAATSSGGKYTAYSTGGRIVLCETDTLKSIGEINLPSAPRLQTTGAHTLAFSPDSKQIAVLKITNLKHLNLTVCNLETGGIDYESNFESQNPFVMRNTSCLLDWSPDSRCLLVNRQTVIDAKTGKTLWTVPVSLEERESPRRLLAPHLLVGLGQKNGIPAITSFVVDEKKLETIQTVVKQGGSVVDAFLPAAIEADRSASRLVVAPDAELRWSANADPLLPNPKIAREPISLRSSVPEIMKVIFSSPQAGIAAVEVEPFANGQKDADKHIEFYDLTTGKPASQCVIPYGSSLVSVSPDASGVLVVDEGDRSRLDIFARKSGKHVVGWKPYQSAAQEDKMVNAFFLTDDVVVTHSERGELVAWTVPQCQAVYHMSLPAGGTIARSPGGKYIVSIEPIGIRLLDGKTGATLGYSRFSFGNLSPDNSTRRRLQEVPGIGAAQSRSNHQPIAFNIDGNEVAAILPDGRGGRLVRWSISDGQMLSELSLSNLRGERVEYCGRNHVLINNRQLYQVLRLEHVWNYLTARGKPADGSPDDRHWYVTAAGVQRTQSVLLGVRLPEPGADQFIRAVTGTERPFLPPGSEVTVTINAAAPSDEIKRNIETAVESWLKFRGLRVAANAEAKIAISLREVPTGEQIEFRVLFGNFGRKGKYTPTTRIDVKDVVCDIELSFGGNVALTAREVVEMGSFFGILRVPADEEDLDAYLHKRLWERMAGVLPLSRIPRHLAATKDGLLTLPGSSTLGPDGAVTRPPVFGGKERRDEVDVRDRGRLKT